MSICPVGGIGMGISLKELAEHLAAELVGDGRVVINAVNSVEQAVPGDVCFASGAKYLEKLRTSRASAVIVSSRYEGIDIGQLVVANVEASLIKALNLFAPKLTSFSGIHPSAVVEKSARLAQDVSVGAHACISHGVRIGKGTAIGAGCVIGENSVIGDNCRMDGNVVVYHNCRIGNHCIIQSGTTIGSSGFGYYFVDGQHRLIPHNGGVIIEDCVEIGANCCVDRAKFGNTIIGAGTKIDNLVQIAHNVVIGKCCLLTGHVGIAGSSRLGDGVVLAGRVGVIDHLDIGSAAVVGAGSLVINDLDAGGHYWGMPATDLKTQLKCLGVFKDLPRMRQELRQLIKKVEALEESKDNRRQG